MKTIIAGSRTFTDYALLKRIVLVIPKITTILSGNAKGADKLGERFANENNITLNIYPANWKAHGKGAGFIRNHIMLRNADTLLALWDGESKGTKHMIMIAEYKINCYIYNKKTNKLSFTRKLNKK